MSLQQDIKDNKKKNHFILEKKKKTSSIITEANANLARKVKLGIGGDKQQNEVFATDLSDRNSCFT